MKRKGHNKEYVKMLVMSGLLVAMNVIFGKFFQISPTEYLRFSIGSLPVIFGGLVFGSLVGGCIGLAGDIIGCVAAGMAINPIIAVGSAAVGAVAGLFKLKGHGKVNYPKIITASFAAHIIGSFIIKSIGMYAYFGTPIKVLAIRLPVSLVNSVLEAVILIALLSRKEIVALLPHENNKEKTK